MKEAIPPEARHDMNVAIATLLIQKDALPVSSELSKDLTTHNDESLDWLYGERKVEVHTIFEAKQETTE